MNASLVESAIKYSHDGYSVIPVGRDKKSLIAWSEYSDRRATEDEIKAWWTRYPHAQIAIVCGEISGVTVIDTDDEESYHHIQENFIPDSIIIPTARTPKGFHFYFRHNGDITNSTRFFEKCDVKNDRGYVLAPPSNNNSGGYSWLPGCSLDDASPPEMPEELADIVMQFSCQPTVRGFGTNNAIYNGCNHYLPESIYEVGPNPVTHADKIDLTEGRRDDSLFHVALSMARGGSKEQEIYKVLELLAKQCVPPFDLNELPAKIKSAFQYAGRRKINFTEEIRRILGVTNGTVSISDIYQEVTNVTERNERNRASDKAAIRNALFRMWKSGELERVGTKDGVYKVVDKDCQAEDWATKECQPVKFYIPFELTDKVFVSPGDVILISGAQNAGKSAFLMNIAKDNRNLYNVHYFSSEMSAAKFKRRMQRFNDCAITDLAQRIKFYQRGGEFADVIKTGEGNLNVIDYLEMHDQFWLVAKNLADIFNKLDGAIAVIALQKEPGREFGRGGSFTQEKPVLALSLDQGRAKITKCKEFPDGQENPQGKIFNFKLIQGCRFIRKSADSGWHKEEVDRHGI